MKRWADVSTWVSPAQPCHVDDLDGLLGAEFLHDCRATDGPRSPVVAGPERCCAANPGDEAAEERLCATPSRRATDSHGDMASQRATEFELGSMAVLELSQLFPASPAESSSSFSAGARRNSCEETFASLLRQTEWVSSVQELCVQDGSPLGMLMPQEWSLDLDLDRPQGPGELVGASSGNSGNEARTDGAANRIPRDAQPRGNEAKDVVNGADSGDKGACFKFGSVQDMDDAEAIRRVMASKKNREDHPIDAKRAKRIIANRQSAARSKERRVRYIANLEEKISFYEKQSGALKATINALQKEATSMAEINDGINRKLKILDILYKQREVENARLREEVLTLRKFYGAGSRASDISQTKSALMESHVPYPPSPCLPDGQSCL